jgi:kynureninase
VVDRDHCLARDEGDDLASLRAGFTLPPNTIYLLGNSLGPLPRTAPAHFQRVVQDEWGHHLIGGWNLSWYDEPTRLGDRIAPLIGASAGEVIVADSTSINLMKVVNAAIEQQRATGHTLVGYEAGSFPTDGYVTESVARAVGASAVALHVIEGALPALPHDLGVMVLSHVDYRSGRLLDMQALTAQLHERDVCAIWDLSHTVGALPIRLDDCDVDYAIGCTYKYLNAGPGAPAFVYVRDRLLPTTQVLPQGWFAHREPFAMSGTFAPTDDIRRLLVGTPSVLACAGLHASLDIFDDVDIGRLRAKSLELSRLFVEVVTAGAADVQVVTPMSEETRGSHVTLRHESSYPIVRALIDRGVVGDFRAPDAMRFAFAPLYIRYVDVYDAACALVDVIAGEAWRDPRYAMREAVT